MSHPGTRMRVCVTALACVVLAGGCDYVRLLRPSVLKQLNSRVVRLARGVRLP